MPGVAQVWLTHKEIDALLAAGGQRGTTVSRTIWPDLSDKLLRAMEGIACPVKRKDGYFASAEEANDWLEFDADQEAREVAANAYPDRFEEWRRWKGGE